MPGQFRHLAADLARDPAYKVHFITCRQGVEMSGITVHRYVRPSGKANASEALVRPLEGAMRFGRAVAKLALEMKAKGIEPALVVVHPGWGEGLFLRDVWPKARILAYAEYYYQPRGGDIGFDPLFPVSYNGLFTSRAMNANLLLSLEQADVLLSPTRWQRSRHPAALQAKTAVIFDGIDTARACPQAGASFRLPPADGGEELVLDEGCEVITYVARNLEPHRGYHVFMQSLPALLAARPKAQVVIVGGTEVSYSPRPRDGSADWKASLAGQVDLGGDAGRVHHVGKLPYGQFLDLLRISSAHIYLTYPFVLSWSCLEAMAIGCAMVASDTAPVREVMVHEENGLLVPFFDQQALVAAVCRLLEDKALAARLRQAARASVVERYNLTDCLQAQRGLIAKMLGRGGG